MPKEKEKKEKKKKKYEKPLSLYPMQFEEAVREISKAKPTASAKKSKRKPKSD